MYVNDITIKHGSMGYRGDQTLISHVLETGSSGNAIFKTKNPERTPPPPFCKIIVLRLPLQVYIYNKIKAVNYKIMQLLTL